MSAIAWVVLVALLAGVGGGVVYTYKSAIVRAEHAESESKELRQVNSEALAENQHLRSLKAQQDVILAERRGKQNAAAEWERKADAKLSKAMQQPEVRAWASTPVPAAVVDSVRDGSGAASSKDGAVAPARKPAASKSGS